MSLDVPSIRKIEISCPDDYQPETSWSTADLLGYNREQRINCDCAYTSSKNIKPALGSECREKTVQVGVYQVMYG